MKHRAYQYNINYNIDSDVTIVWYVKRWSQAFLMTFFFCFNAFQKLGSLLGIFFRYLLNIACKLIFLTVGMMLTWLNMLQYTYNYLQIIFIPVLAYRAVWFFPIYFRLILYYDWIIDRVFLRNKNAIFTSWLFTSSAIFFLFSCLYWYRASCSLIMYFLFISIYLIFLEHKGVGVGFLIRIEHGDLALIFLLQATLLNIY